jgi:predicted NUDIX family NTP pyrophosphohydrolase
MRSAGILLHRLTVGVREVFLVHPGGPFWARKDAGAWSIPKGEIGPDEEPLASARREFLEETGFELDGTFVELPEARQAGGKRVLAFAVEGDCDPAAVVSNTFEMEWPPNSGKRRSFPEVDRAAWFAIPEAMEKINPGQRALLEALERLVG